MAKTVVVSPELLKKIEDYSARAEKGELPMLSPEESLARTEKQIKRGDDLLTTARSLVKPKPPQIG